MVKSRGRETRQNEKRYLFWGELKFKTQRIHPNKGQLAIKIFSHTEGVHLVSSLFIVCIVFTSLFLLFSSPSLLHLVVSAETSEIFWRMNGLMKRLQKIQAECVDKQGNNVVVDETMDEFTRLKKKLAFDVKSICISWHTPSVLQGILIALRWWW